MLHLNQGVNVFNFKFIFRVRFIYGLLICAALTACASEPPESTAIDEGQSDARPVGLINWCKENREHIECRDLE